MGIAHQGDRLSGKQVNPCQQRDSPQPFSNEIRKLRQLLGKPNGDPSHDKKGTLDDEKALGAWLANTPVYLQLQWFDTVECTKVSSELRNRRWSSEITARDKLFLEKLGMTQD